MKALLIIDMQKGSFKPYSIRYNTFEVIAKINNVSEVFRQKKYPIIFVQHNGTNENCYLPNTDDWELLPELTRQAADIIVSKTANDAFYNTELYAILAQNNVSDLFITGCATDFCIDATVKAALSNDFKITIVEDGHTTASRPYLDAQTLVNHYNWLWADMSPTKYKMTVVKTADLQI